MTHTFSRLMIGKPRGHAADLLAIALVLLMGTAARADASGPALLFSADTAGHVAPCASCAEGQGLGGLARRATLLADQPQPYLLLDAGNALFGGDAGDGRVIVQAYNALGYDVANLAYRDFRLGKAHTQALIAEADFAVVSANVVDRETNRPLAEPYAVVERDGVRTAVIGVTQRPAGLAHLPHLAEQLEGLAIEEPAAALDRWLPEAQQEADRLVLLYYGSSAGLAPLVAAYGEQLDAVLVGGVRPTMLRADERVTVAGTTPHGQRLGRVAPADAADPDAPRVSQLAVEPTLDADPEVTAVIEAALPTPTDEQSRGDNPPRTLPEALTAEALAGGMRSSGENRALYMEIRGATLHDTYDDREAPPGHRWLVLDAWLENQLAFDLVFELDYAEAVLVASLPRQLYLLIDGTQVQRLAPEHEAFADAMPDGFTLHRAGAAAQGKLVFAVPEAGVESLSLRYYHDEYAPLVVPLLGEEPADLAAAGEPVAGPLTHPLMKLGVYGVERHEQWAGRAAPSGAQWLVVDVRGLGLWTLEADARALDADAPADAKAHLPKVMEYLEAAKLLQVVVDGEYGYVREPDMGTLLTDPALLPDAMAGGLAVFAVPADATAIELVCYFPEMRGTTHDGVAEPMRFTLAGEPAEPEPEVALAVIQDEPTPLALFNARLTDRFGERTANAGEALLVIDAAIRNDSDEGGLMQLSDRLSLDTDAEGQATPEAIENRGHLELDEPVWVPAGGERRRFNIIFRVPEATRSARLRYSGVSVATSVELDLSGEGGGVVAGEPVHEERADVAVADDGAAPAADRVAHDGAAADAAGNGDASPAAGAADGEASAEGEPAPAGDAPPAAQAAATLVGRQLLPAGADEAAEVSAANEAVRVTVTGVTVHEEVAERSLRGDNLYLIVDTRWQALAPADGEAEQARYELPSLAEQVYAVHNGRRLLQSQRIRGAADLLPDHLHVPDTDRDAADAAGDDLPPNTRVGQLAFVIPADEPLEQLELHLLDRRAGNLELAVLTPEGGPLQHEPVLPVEANRLLRAGVFRHEVAPSFMGSRARHGHQWMVVDLRGQSLRQVDVVDALEADAATLAGTPTAPGYYEWPAWPDHLQLVIDGRYAFVPSSNRHDLPAPARFLPGAMTGGEVAFHLPEPLLSEARSIELVAGFPQTAMPAAEPVHQPAPLRFQLQGDRPVDAEPAQPIAAHTDRDVRVDVLAADQPPASPNGRDPRAGQAWLWVDMQVTAGESPIMFDPSHLWLVNAAGQRLRADAEGDRLPHGPAAGRNRAFWVPAGASRRFELIWAVPEAHADAPLVYEGQTRLAFLDLPGRAATTPVRDLATPGMDVFPDREPGGIASVGLTAEQVNSAIDRARDYLWHEIRDEEWLTSRVGYYLPILVALVHADAHEEYPEFDLRLRQFLDRVRPIDTGSRSTYGTGLLAMLVESYGDPHYLPLLEQCARYLIEDQGPDGAWDYAATVPARFFPEPPPIVDSPFEVSGGRSLDRPELPDTPLRRTLPWAVNDDGDNSVTQFAVLGLWSAQRAGIPIDDEVWRRMLRSILDRQASDDEDRFRGWAYHRGGRAYGSMTAAGICTTAIALHHLDPDADPLDDPRIRGGVAWLAEHWRPGKHPEAGRDEMEWLFYYTYSVERVGQILGVEFLGEHEWYPQLARWLVDEQAGSGSWTGVGTENPRLATSFALLCLTRATPSLDVEAETIERGGEGDLLASATLPEMQHNVYIILDASGSMLAEMDGRPKFDIARDAVKQVVAMLPPETHAALRVYGHRLRAIEDGADEDTTLEIPWGPLDPAAFNETLDALRPRGKTPLTLSLEQAVQDLRRARGEGRTLVILLTDGGEDSHSPRDPAGAAAPFAENDDWELYVVGFDIQRDDWTEQLHAITRAGGGVYRPAPQADTLIPQLEAVVRPAAPPFQVVDEAGEVVVAEGRFDEPVTLPEGRYTLRSVDAEEPVEIGFWVNTNRTTRVRFEVSALPRTSPADDAGGAVQVVEAPPAGEAATQEQPPPKFCTQCGAELRPNARFCTECGQAVPQ